MTKIQALVDRLGKVKAQIADLEEEEADIRQQLINSHREQIEGRLFRATINTGPVIRVDYKEVVEHMPETPMLKKLVRKFTEEKERTIVKVVSR